MVLTIKNFESQNVGPGVVETAPTNLVGVAGTLKATLTWTSATGESGVIWSEEKLVRKEGSAPSNSLDGTTVTTITTKDTYASTGYEDTGLDSTKTYYYKVFAVYDNGTEMGSTAVDITPEEYEPTVDTLLWYPLETDANDYSGKGQNLTAGAGVTFGTYNGIECAKCSASTNATIGGNVSTLPIGSNPRTTSIWLYDTGNIPTGNRVHTYFSYGTKDVGKRWACFFINDTSTARVGYLCSTASAGSNFVNDVTGGTYEKNKRVNIITTASGRDVKLYKNGELIATKTFNSVNTSGTNLTINPMESFYDLTEKYFSNFIIEDTARTDQQIADYYNGLKTKYGHA